MTTRLVLAIISTLLEEAAVVAIVLWGLPQLEIYIPLAGLIALMVVWGVFSVFIYRMGSRALRRKPVVDLLPMVGSRGKVVSQLALDGQVRIKGELWQATLAGERIDAGEEVIVVDQEGLKLIVRKISNSDLKGTE